MTWGSLGIPLLSTTFSILKNENGGNINSFSPALTEYCTALTQGVAFELFWHWYLIFNTTETSLGVNSLTLIAVDVGKLYFVIIK